MNASKGFTLLEMLLVLVVIALSASTVMLTTGQLNGSQGKAAKTGEQLNVMIEYAADWATMENRLIGLRIQDTDWQFVVSEGNEWQEPDTQYRLPSKGGWDESWHIRLLPASLKQRSSRSPQIIVTPDGEITPFTLQVEDRDSGKTLFTLTSQGGLPLLLSSGEQR
ncbi:type II secretion system minor pseudopilin GspH [Scandinavium lactucae]|uniref:Type II secretion system protein H n=1 Tax=Scandinavium lactucae TaxID=3095028 RepID=A0ABU4QL39_9ENTR|nr:MULTISPECIES: type II secretion system minor pseudopilin GspH [unclassified Scandinavium]MDX6040023.1 type II secretion system minor pseudopilin GspH [Scandinavium sp. V105_6]MDX6048582.1 type II secretion system minor pseudopilin GspH [Scandinavium sp. V105_1]